MFILFISFEISFPLSFMMRCTWLSIIQYPCTKKLYFSFIFCSVSRNLLLSSSESNIFFLSFPLCITWYTLYSPLFLACLGIGFTFLWKNFITLLEASQEPSLLEFFDDLGEDICLFQQELPKTIIQIIL